VRKNFFGGFFFTPAILAALAAVFVTGAAWADKPTSVEISSSNLTGLKVAVEVTNGQITFTADDDNFGFSKATVNSLAEFAVGNLPSGLSVTAISNLSAKAVTLTIAGTPNAAGSYKLGFASSIPKESFANEPEDDIVPALKAGDDLFSDGNFVVSVAKGTPKISFGASTATSYGDVVDLDVTHDIVLTNPAPSAIELAITSGEDNASLSGQNLTVLSVGSEIAVTASMAENDHYEAAAATFKTTPGAADEGGFTSQGGALVAADVEFIAGVKDTLVISKAGLIPAAPAGRSLGAVSTVSLYDFSGNEIAAFGVSSGSGGAATRIDGNGNLVIITVDEPLAGAAAQLTVRVATSNYGDLSATVNLSAIAKAEAEAGEVVFDDAAHVYTGEALAIGAIGVADSAAFAGPGHNGPFLRSYVYTGTSASGAAYGPASDPPVNAGVYNVAATIQSLNSYAKKSAVLEISPKSLADAAITPEAASVVYSGSAQEPGFTVTDGDRILIGGVDFDGAYDSGFYAGNRDAGTAGIAVVGINNYADTLRGEFTITRAPLTLDVAASAIPSKVYDGTDAVDTSKAVFVFTPLLGGDTLENVLDFTISDARYDSVNVTANTAVTATVALVEDGPVSKNYTLAGGSFSRSTEDGPAITIVEELDASYLTFTIPVGHKVTGEPQGIGEVTVKGTNYGEVSVLYNGEADLPVDIGEYEVTVEITGGSNYAASSLVLGKYSIADTVEVADTSDVSVASIERVIPNGKGGQAVVAPVSVVAGEFTVGPNPVARASGKAGFFWQGKALKSGTLYVFDASGNLLKKAAAADKGVSVDRREIGSWNLADAKGRPVAEGTYLIKGALTAKDGSKVKVSAVVGVK